MPARLLAAPALALGAALALSAASAPASAADDLPVLSLTPAPAPTAPPAAGAPGKAPAAAAKVEGNPVLARINGVELHRSDIDAAQRGLPPQAQKMPLDQIYPMLLERMVDGQLVAAAARKDKLDQDPDVQQRMKAYEDRLIQQTYLNKVVQGAESDDKLKAQYDKTLKDKPGKEEVRARHILVASEADAKQVIAQLDKGADFAALAKKSSTDPAAENGGDLGYFSKDEMVPEFAAAAFALPVGKYSKTPVHSQFGWHVIKVEDHRMGKPPSFEESRDDLAEAVAQEAVNAKIAELRQGAKIETFGLDGAPMPLPAPIAK